MEPTDLYNDPDCYEFEEIIIAIKYTRKLQGDATSLLVDRL